MIQGLEGLRCFRVWDQDSWCGVGGPAGRVVSGLVRVLTCKRNPDMYPGPYTLDPPRSHIISE